MSDDLKNHFGHELVVGVYGNPQNPHNVSVECKTCHCVIIELYDAVVGLNITRD
jgi:hypothetical protein